MDNLLQPERHKPNGMGGRAGVSLDRTDGVRDVVLEVWATDVLAIPARRHYNMHEKASGAICRWERVRRIIDPLVVETHELDGLVFVRVGHRASVGVAGDHAEAFGKSLNVGFGATMQVVDAKF